MTGWGSSGSPARSHFRDEGPEKIRHRSLRHFPAFFVSRMRPAGSSEAATALS
ncbi:Hypothetical protein AA314_01914 [Archangium gephyra]|uniref:Uncharacterized protein n=1 Tax=Archangium gephyra TaxID=48 RepID=A0AAC8Q3B4_9BACT|nr:Hypothetical protein AA314_01914 [Archangium gephyra]